MLGIHHLLVEGQPHTYLVPKEGIRGGGRCEKAKRTRTGENVLHQTEGQEGIAAGSRSHWRIVPSAPPLVHPAAILTSVPECLGNMHGPIWWSTSLAAGGAQVNPRVCSPLDVSPSPAHHPQGFLPLLGITFQSSHFSSGGRHRWK